MFSPVILSMHAAQVVSYLPSFYFGSLLLLFGVEILSDWLLKSWKKVTRKEYGLLLATFAAVMLGAPLEQCGSVFVPLAVASPNSAAVMLGEPLMQ